MKGFPDRALIQWSENQKKTASGRSKRRCPHCGKLLNPQKAGEVKIVPAHWRVRIKDIEGVGSISQYFWVNEYGSKRKAYTAAREYRDEMLEYYGLRLSPKGRIIKNEN